MNAHKKVLGIGGVGLLAGLLLLALGTKSFATRFATRASLRSDPSWEGLPLLLDRDAERSLPLQAPPADQADIDALLAEQSRRTEADAAEAARWQAGAVIRWNEIARGLVTKYNTSPVVASRVLALLSVAQHDAMIRAVHDQKIHKRPFPASVDGRVKPLFSSSSPNPRAEWAYPSEHAAVAAASAAVLGYLYKSKEQVEQLDAQAAAHARSRLVAGVSRPSDIAAGERIGREVADRLIALAKTDASVKAGVNWQGTIPVGKDKWASSEHPPVIPLRPRWGAVRPWLLSSPSQLRPEPPPDVDSPEFAKALEEVSRISRTRTPDQLRIAQFWGDGPGSITPPGHWNRIAAELLTSRNIGELGAARVMAYMNMAVMDAGIACWEAKYHYWFLRPTQADPTISIPVGLPNFPSYPSGHSTFSGAAAEVLGHFFPSEKDRMSAMAEEASMSRIYGGIHYRFDAEKGMAMGRSIGKLAIEKEKAEGASLPGLVNTPPIGER